MFCTFSMDLGVGQQNGAFFLKPEDALACRTPNRPNATCVIAFVKPGSHIFVFILCLWFLPCNICTFTHFCSQRSVYVPDVECPTLCSLLAASQTDLAQGFGPIKKRRCRLSAARIFFPPQFWTCYNILDGYKLQPPHPPPPGLCLTNMVSPASNICLGDCVVLVQVLPGAEPNFNLLNRAMNHMKMPTLKLDSVFFSISSLCFQSVVPGMLTGFHLPLFDHYLPQDLDISIKRGLGYGCRGVGDWQLQCSSRIFQYFFVFTCLLRDLGVKQAHTRAIVGACAAWPKCLPPGGAWNSPRDLLSQYLFSYASVFHQVCAPCRFVCAQFESRMGLNKIQGLWSVVILGLGIFICDVLHYMQFLRHPNLAIQNVNSQFFLWNQMRAKISKKLSCSICSSTAVFQILSGQNALTLYVYIYTYIPVSVSTCSYIFTCAIPSFWHTYARCRYA